MKNFWKFNYLIIFTFFLSNLCSLNFIGQSNESTMKITINID